MKPTKGLSIPVIWPLLQTICIFAPAERSGPERSSNPSGAEISVDVIFHPKISIDGFTSGLKELDRIQLYFKKVRTAVEGVRAPERIIQLQMSFLLSCEYRCIRHFVGICFPNWGSRKRSISRASSRRRGRVLLESEYSRTRCDTLAITSPSSKCKLYFNMMYIYILYDFCIIFWDIYMTWIWHILSFSYLFASFQRQPSALFSTMRTLQRLRFRCSVSRRRIVVGALRRPPREDTAKHFNTRSRRTDGGIAASLQQTF